MQIADIAVNDVLVSTDQHGTGYYRVIKVCKVKIRVRSENGNQYLAYPNVFDRKVSYPVNV